MQKSTIDNKLKAVIYDLDGTIADSFDVFVETLEEVTKRSEPLTDEQIRDLRGSSLSDVINKLGIRKWQIPITVLKGRREIAKKVDRIEAFPDMPKVIHAVSTAGLDQYILSTNAKEGIKSFLDRYNLLDYMTDIYADIGLTGKTKSMKQIMKTQGFTSEECIYIGDETRDIEASKKAGVRCIAVEWGFSSPEALKALNPAFLVKNPEELAQAILSFVK